MGQWSWKCPGSPHRQQAGPGLTAAPAAEGKARDCRRGDGGAAVGSAPPPRRGHRSPWPLPLLGGARGAACTRDLGERGEGRRRERGGERPVNPGLADPGARHHMVLRQLDGLRQRRRAVALDPLRRSPG